SSDNLPSSQGAARVRHYYRRTPGYMDLLPSAHRNIRDASRGTAAGEHARWIGAGMTQTDHGARRMAGRVRLLPVWTGPAMGAGRLLRGVVPRTTAILPSLHATSGASPPICSGLLITRYPVFATAGYARRGTVTSDKRLLVPSPVLHW